MVLLSTDIVVRLLTDEVSGVKLQILFECRETGRYATGGKGFCSYCGSEAEKNYLFGME
jgi:hypothetical protein